MERDGINRGEFCVVFGEEIEVLFLVYGGFVFLLEVFRLFLVGVVCKFFNCEVFRIWGWRGVCCLEVWLVGLLLVLYVDCFIVWLFCLRSWGLKWWVEVRDC